MAVNAAKRIETSKSLRDYSAIHVKYRLFVKLIFCRPGSTARRGDHSSREYASVGVTCEVLSMKEEEEYGLRRLLLKAEGRQRFKLISMQSQLDGYVQPFLYREK